MPKFYVPNLSEPKFDKKSTSIVFDPKGEIRHLSISFGKCERYGDWIVLAE
jgi:hypothetical protein